jgi:hypothetical protein
MNFDRNGVQVRNTQPVRQLVKSTRVLTIDSRDRDLTKFVKVNAGSSASDPGDYVVYLPRVYENVVSLRLRSAIIAAPQTGGFGTNNYILMGLEGLNKIDETSYSANRSGLVDNSFAKISNPNITSGATNNTYTIFYNDKVDEENVTRYTPAIGRLDRLHVTLKYHPGVASATLGDVTGQVINAPITFGTSENSFTIEIEYMDNSFSDFSSFETRLDAKASEQNIYMAGRGY